MSVRLPPSICVGCGMKNDAASFTREESVWPSPGDISVCFYCGHLSAYNTDLKLRPLTDAEMREVADDPLLIQVQKARAKFQRTKKH